LLFLKEYEPKLVVSRTYLHHSKDSPESGSVQEKKYEIDNDKQQCIKGKLWLEEELFRFFHDFFFFQSFPENEKEIKEEKGGNIDEILEFEGKSKKEIC
jgi:hypothetical protein